MTLIDARSEAAYVGCAAVNARQYDPFADTIVLPQDELAIRRERKRLGLLSPSKLQRLLVAAALRKKSTQRERDQ